jgi:mRNA interferase MazF
LVTVATSGDYGKPRPALIVQANAYAEHPSITVLPLTSELHDMPLLRVTVEPGENTGLRLRSQVMVDKTTTIPRAKAGSRIGRLDETTRANVDQALAAFLGVGLSGSCDQNVSDEGRIGREQDHPLDSAEPTCPEPVPLCAARNAKRR